MSDRTLPVMANRVDCPARTDGGPTADLLVGTVRTWHADRAYGWIESSPGRCYFVHLDDVVGRVELRPDQFVRFTPIRTARGPRAVAVEILEEVR